MLRFEQSIKSKHTLNNYKFHLERFLDFAKLKDYDSLINLSKEERREFALQKELYYSNKGFS